ncbi:uncharacterized protein FPRO_03014 [Fusarium proliferatum ET1]|uniref:Uncharacterized protein n=1 Tax=Fusarium proliferatum (strain ET1) TaxID=1227346 RepID=A0A1L7VAV1_FUSPR|nr:uncharacterized protein FPRO_03014 [Fusarium proliferatum ET1]CZR36726.1 uncharacterized protein FPRO_03014 [Fusarium proliferatum ET1]
MTKKDITDSYCRIKAFGRIILNQSIFVVSSVIHEKESTLELGAVAATLHRGRLDKPLRIGRRLNGSWLNRFSRSAPTNHATYVPDAWRQWPKPPLMFNPPANALPLATIVNLLSPHNSARISLEDSHLGSSPLGKS